MPILEYKYSECESKFEILIKSNDDNKISCPECDPSKVKKLFSAFSASTGSVGYSDNSCAAGNCNVEVPSVSGCASGMCGVN